MRAPLLAAATFAAAIAGCGDGIYTAQGLPPLGGGGTCQAPQRLCLQGCFLPSALEACGSACDACSTAVPGATAICEPFGNDFKCGIECPAGQLRVGLGCAPAAAVAGGEAHTCAIAQGGTVKCWGANDAGQALPGAPASVLVPADVRSGATAIAAGPTHTCAALGATRTLDCWGAGGGIAQLPPTAPSDVVSIATGASHTCVLKADNTVACWGTGPAATPIPGLTGVAAITSGLNHACAHVPSTGVLCWGDNSLGQLGNATVGNVSFAVAGHNHTCAATNDQRMFCWGANPADGNGTLALPSLATPRQLTPLPPRRTVGGGGQELVRAAVLAPMAAGGAHTCFVIDVDGVACFGQDDRGQLAATWADELVKQGATTAGVRVIGAGADHTCAVYSDGLKCWGANGRGQLGAGHPDPVAIGTLVPVSGK